MKPKAFLNKIVAALWNENRLLVSKAADFVFPTQNSSVWLKASFVLQLGSTAIGIQTSEGVVLAVEKRVTSPLIEPSSIEKIMEVDSHIGRDF